MYSKLTKFTKLSDISDLHARTRWIYFALALLGAIALWYTVNAREQVERVVEVRLDYKGLPQGLVVTSGQLNKISVRLRGPLELLRSISSRELYHTLDLSSLTAGTNVMPLAVGSEPMADLRGFEVVEVMPPRLTLQADTILESRVPVEAKLRESPFGSALKLSKVQIQPETVTVRGPASQVSKLQKITVEVPVSLESEDTLITDDVPVVAPPGMEVSPSTVKVTRLLDVQRRTISLQRDVILDSGDASAAATLNLSPSRVTLRISVPSSTVKDAAYLAQIQASLEPDSALERLAASTDAVTIVEPVKVNLPPGAQLISVSPEKIRIGMGK